MNNEMWAWYDASGEDYHFIYPAKLQVEMCSPDGFRTRMKRGEGRIVKVKIVEIEEAQCKK